MNKASVADLVSAVRREADAADFPIDEPVYRRSGRDPKDPILFAGSLEGPLCVVGRDLGKDEVAAGEPLIGAAGRLVRLGILAAWNNPSPAGANPPEGPPLREALNYALLTNTVPYKPPGNKAYAESVRRRFRPFLERLLVHHWTGTRIITLGTEAFHWFEPYADPAEFAARGKSDARFQTAFLCRLPLDHSAPGRDKPVIVLPLPHPSPLNRRWYDKFPTMLSDRLAEVRRELEDTPTY